MFRFTHSSALKQISLMVSSMYILLLILLAVLADFIAPYHYAAGDLSIARRPPSQDHILGTDHLGRDVFSRLIYGTRVLLYVVSVVLSIAIPIGVMIGVISGYFGGLIDLLVSRVVDMLMVFPTILIALFIIAVLGPGVDKVVLAIVITEIPVFARLTRALAIVEKEHPYIEAAKALGAGHLRIVFKYILPNISGPVIVQAAFSASTAILWEASLSFLGLGVQPPTPSWGLMMYEARRYFRTDPYLVLSPGFAIFMTVLMFNILGEKLRDMLDPRLRYL